MRNIFLILSVIAVLCYSYGKVTSDQIFSSIGIYSLVPLLLTHYLINKKERTNLTYITATLAAYIGDLYFFNVDVSINVLSMGGFIIFNLLMTLVVFEKMNIIEFRKTLLTSLLLTAIFMLITYFVFIEFDKTIIIILIYFLSLSFLISLCALNYKTTKTKASLFFLLGVCSYIIASISTEFIYLKKTNILILLINPITYYLTNYFYAVAMIERSEKDKNQQQT